jgi:hypothetical protein
VAPQTPGPGRTVRRLTLRSGPLTRSTDRLELLSLVLLGAVLLTAVAIALAVATATYSTGRSEVVSQAAERHRVDALLTEDASPAGAGAGTDQGRAAAVWTAPSGAHRTGHVPAGVGTEAGASVSIWVDQRGDRTSRPLGTGDVVSRAVGAAVLTFVGIAAIAVGAQLVVRRMLDRSRSRRWAAEWAMVGPVWSRRVP